MTSDDAQLPVAMSVRDLFSDHLYRIPLYQRAYAWTRAEIGTLLRDVRDARFKAAGQDGGSDARDYFIGSLVVNTVYVDGELLHEVVDGQQRLTTLFILLAVAHSHLASPLDARLPTLSGRALTFEGRPVAQNDLRRLAKDGSGIIDQLNTAGIATAAEMMSQAVAGTRGDTIADNEDDQVVFDPDDLQYLLDNVKILRTALPGNTDLNHYFEVMNTRGEQLEKHEILKARMTRELHSAADKTTFAHIWDSCAVLDRHIQLQFSTKRPDPSDAEADRSARDRIFGDGWNRWMPTNPEELFTALAEARRGFKGTAPVEETATSGDDREQVALTSILSTPWAGPGGDAPRDADDETGSYNAIIDFPNLLLHVLKLHRDEPPAWAPTETRTAGGVSLMDKNILGEFDKVTSWREADVRKFAWLLLKTRFLLDTYVIRTQVTAGRDHEENWVLHRAHKNKSQKKLTTRSSFGSDEALRRRILLLQSMFQVTDTRRSGKHFLYNVLRWLHAQEDCNHVSGQQFIYCLEGMARDRLATLYSPDVLHTGTAVPNFVFNFLDYTLWRLAAESLSAGRPEKNVDLFRDAQTEDLSQATKEFRFRYRTSVEHFYPTRPARAEGHEPLPSAVSNNFGNLCLMGRSENSRRNNLMPLAKVTEFKSTEQSLKFQLMAWKARGGTSGEPQGWGEAEIDSHGTAMIEVLERTLDLPAEG